MSEIRPTDTTLVGAAVHSVRACTPEEIAEVVAASRGRPLHAHVSEQPAENEGSLSTFGRTPTGVFADAGALNRNFTAVHGTHLTEADRALLGAGNATVCICPSTERDLADGIGEIPALVQAGSRISIGSDSNAVIDAFDETRSLEMNERLRTGRRGHLTIGQMMGALTDHRSLGWEDAGSIAEGHRADLVTLDLGSVRLAGSSVTTMLPTVLLAGHPADVTTVTIDGVDRVTERRYQAGDVGREFAELIPRLFS